MFKKHFALLVLILAMGISVVGCGSRTAGEQEKQSAQPAQQQTGSISAPASTSEIKQDSGTYMGEIDGNSIEIRISGIQDPNHAYKAFRFSDEVKSRFPSYGLKTGDQVRFSYFINSDNQNILKNIERISN